MRWFASQLLMRQFTIVLLFCAEVELVRMVSDGSDKTPDLYGNFEHVTKL